MSSQKFTGILKEVVEHYPNIDIVDFLQQELRLPLFKAEALAARIEKEVLQKTKKNIEPNVKFLLEKTVDTKPSLEAPVYSVDSLSEKEFEYFMKWLFEQLGYEIQLEKSTKDSGIDLVATKGNEEILIQARKYPKTLTLSDAIVLISQEAKLTRECSKSIVVSTTYFTPKAIANAQNLGIELWDRDTLTKKIIEAKQKVNLEEQTCFPKFKGSLLENLLKLSETKQFIIESRADKKYDLFLPGVKYPLLTFQSDSSKVTQCIYRIKYNQPVGEAEGEALISIDVNNGRVGPDEEQAYALISQYLEQFLE